jgi:daunorubicin/doxorubicin transport system permease protein
VTHLVTAVRALIDGAPATGAVVWVLVASGTLVAVFAPLTLYLLRSHE